MNTKIFIESEKHTFTLFKHSCVSFSTYLFIAAIPKIVQNLVVGYNPDGKNGNLVVFCFASEVKHAEPSVFVNLKMVGRLNHVTKPEVK